MQSNPTKCKVCVISALYKPYERGGAEKIAELTAQGLLENGHKVFVVTSSPWQGFFSLFPNLLKSDFPRKSDFVKIYRFFPLNIFSFADIGKYPLFFRLIWRLFDTFNFHSFLVLWHILKKEQPDFVWTHNLTGLGLLTPMLLKILKIPHIHTLHDVSLIEPSGLIVKDKESGGLLIRLVWSAVARKLFGSPSLVISPSKWLLDFYLKHGFFGNSKMLVKQNPLSPLVIPTRRFGGEESRGNEVTRGSPQRLPRDSSSSDRCRSPQNDREEPSGILQLLYIGQLEKQKGILFLISVLDELAHPHPIPRLRQVGAGIPVVENDLGTSPSSREGEEGGGGYNFRLSVVGTGKLLPCLKKMVEARNWLTICGKLDSEDVSKIWEKIHITLVPSLIYENSPTVIYESLSRGIPVIASRIGGIPELVDDGKNGFLFEAGDKEDLKNKLIQILKNPQILDDLRQKVLTFEAKTPIIYVKEILSVII